jgi:cysteine-rich repeat protein
MYHSIFLMRNRVAMIVSAVAVSLLASSAMAQDVTKCARTLAKEAAKVERKRAKGMRKCFDAAVKAGTPDTVCPDPDNAAKIADAETKMQGKVTDSCNLVTVADLGFTGLVSRCVLGSNDGGLCTVAGDCFGGTCTPVDECPDLFNGNLATSCSAPLTSPNDVASCLICNGNNTVLAPITIAYQHTALPIPSIEPESSDVKKCQRNVGKSTAKYFDKVRKALAKCKDGVIKAGSGSCPDGDTTAKIGEALTKFQEKVAKDCVQGSTYPNGLDRAGIFDGILFPVPVGGPIIPIDGINAYRDTISETIETIAQCSSELSTGDLDPACQPLCGNGKIEAGESCDDGNQVDGDACPSDCTIAACTDGGDVTATINFTPPAGVTLTAVQVLVGYPDDKVRIPGSANQSLVLNRITVTDPLAALSANDLNYAVRLLVNTDGTTAISGGPSLLTVDFDTCTGAPAVADGEFACVVQATSAFGPVADAVFATTCSVDVP